jgi:hypothetical protein
VRDNGAYDLGACFLKAYASVVVQVLGVTFALVEYVEFGDVP